ncbi:MAG: hypothetical protein WDZ62_02460 [Candidatus Pacearchaeota archaeon]
MKIEFFGTENFSQGQKNDLNEFTKSYSSKIKRIVGEIKSIEVRVKIYHREGKAHKYSINISVTPKTRKFVSDSEGWDLGITVKEGFEKIISQMNKEFKTSN